MCISLWDWLSGTCCLRLPQSVTQWYNCVTSATCTGHSLWRGRTDTLSYTGSRPWCDCGLTRWFGPVLSLVFCHPEKHDRHTLPLLLLSLSVLVFSSPSPPSVLWHQSAGLDHALVVSWETRVKMGMGEAGSVGVLFPSGSWDLGLRRRGRRRKIGRESQEQLKQEQPHRQVVFCPLYVWLSCFWSCPDIFTPLARWCHLFAHVVWIVGCWIRHQRNPLMLPF